MWSHLHGPSGALTLDARWDAHTSHALQIRRTDSAVGVRLDGYRLAVSRVGLRFLDDGTFLDDGRLLDDRPLLDGRLLGGRDVRVVHGRTLPSKPRCARQLVPTRLACWNLRKLEPAIGFEPICLRFTRPPLVPTSSTGRSDAGVNRTRSSRFCGPQPSHLATASSSCASS